MAVAERLTVKESPTIWVNLGDPIAAQTSLTGTNISKMAPDTAGRLAVRAAGYRETVAGVSGPLFAYKYGRL